ncbi:hypothetical protein [Arthrobacter sp. fls2-241-R2A-172]|uniref:hypothetical protein n=1 Tax=Arthrobacter sp. fls2-241-R2A-172 TaxID=3040325 RepID=UPI00254DF257|nr:hypothetical protein [Arthrobacter sp. fls2-241-R2A-172]
MSDPGIWTAVGATAATTSALTGLTVHVINKVAEARARPEADWIVQLWAWILEDDPNSPEIVPPDMVSFRGEAMNCGDAKGFSVVVEASDGTRVLMSTPLANATPFGITAAYHEAFAVLEPGAKFNFTGRMRKSDWSEASIVINWITSPTRLKKHLTHETKCSKQVPNPGGLYDDAE